MGLPAKPYQLRNHGLDDPGVIAVDQAIALASVPAKLEDRNDAERSTHPSKSRDGDPLELTALEQRDDLLIDVCSPADIDLAKLEMSPHGREEPAGLLVVHARMVA